MNQTTSIDVAAKPRQRRKLLYRVLWSLLALVVGVCLFWTYSYYSALWERDALIAELRAKGEPVWWDEVADKYLGEQSSKSGADLFLKALWELGGDFNAAKGRSLPSATLDSLRKSNPEPTILPEVKQELELAEPSFKLVREAVRRPPGLLTKRLVTDDPACVGLPHIQTARALHRMLSWEVYDALARNDSRRAYRGVRLAFQSSEQLAAEPFLICQVVRVVLKGLACDDLATCLSYAAPTDEEFRALDQLLAAHDDGFNVDPVFKTERAMLLATFGSREFLPIYLWNDRGSGWSASGARSYRLWVQIVSSPAGLPATVRSQTEMARLIERVRPLIDRPDVRTSEITEACDEAEQRSPVHRLSTGKEFFTDWLRKFHGKLVVGHQRLILARVALRLRRHFDQHGRLPEKLEDLCDDTMPKIRLEWFQNQPIVYKPRATGFRLELPESIVPPEARYRLSETPILSDFGLEIEFKTVKQGPTK